MGEGTLLTDGQSMVFPGEMSRRCRALLAVTVALACTNRRDTALHIEEGTGYGTDQVAGVLHVTSTRAYFENGGRRITLIQDPPMSATGHEELMARTTEALRKLAGQRVRARGDLQGSILWDARVERVE